MKKFIYLLSVCIGLLGSGNLWSAQKGPQPEAPMQKGQLAEPIKAPDAPNFQISDEELKALNLDPKEAEELRQFFDALNNLTPAQKQELEEIGKATEERMRQQDLDPNNLDDVMKFMETEGLMEQQPPNGQKPSEKKEVKEKPLPARPQPERPAPTKAEKPEVFAVSSPADTLTMINELSHHLASLRQKAITMPSMIEKLDSIENEIAQLSFYLNVLRSPDLVKLLGSKESVNLHSTLEKLHNTLKTYEPSISARKRSDVINYDDPYEVLELPYTATDAEIKARYTELAAQRSPEVVEKQLRKEGCDEKICKKMIKAARRTFDLIQGAYDSLTKNRASVDDYLRTKMAKEARKEAASGRAFDSLFAGMTASFTKDQLLTQIHQLLEKNKPQELAQMKAQVELEKKVYERSKKRITVPQARPSQRPTGGQFDPFYKKMAQQRPPAPMKPTRGEGTPKPKGERKEKPEKGATAAEQSDKGKKDDKKKDEDKKKEEEKKKEDDKKKDGKKSGEPSKEDVAKLAEIGSLGKLFETAKKQKDVEVTYPPRTPDAEPMTAKVDLQDIMTRLNNELLNGDVKNQEAAMHLHLYFAEMNLPAIIAALKKTAPGKGKKLSGAPAQYWKDNVAKYKDLVEDWFNKVVKILDATERNNASIKGKIPQAKRTQHGLDIPDIDVWSKEKPPARDVAEDNIDLGKIRGNIKAIRTYINDTSTE